MACDVDNPNVQAFLKLIRYAEHYPDESDHWYNSMFGGGKFTGYQSHPKDPVESGARGRPSLAHTKFCMARGRKPRTKASSLISLRHRRISWRSPNLDPVVHWPQYAQVTSEALAQDWQANGRPYRERSRLG